MYNILYLHKFEQGHGWSTVFRIPLSDYIINLSIETTIAKTQKKTAENRQILTVKR